MEYTRTPFSNNASGTLVTFLTFLRHSNTTTPMLLLHVVTRLRKTYHPLVCFGPPCCPDILAPHLLSPSSHSPSCDPHRLNMNKHPSHTEI